MCRIPDETVQAVREANSLIDVASEYLELISQGNLYVAKCFRNHGPSDEYPVYDDTPSLTFHQGPDGEWRYYCYGCGLGRNETEKDKGPSDVFKFVQQYHRYTSKQEIDFPTVVRTLGERAGIPVPPPTPPDPRIERLKEQATTRSRRLWHNLINNQEAMNYLTEERGLSEEDIKNPSFRLGLADNTDPYENCRNRISFGVCEVTGSASTARIVGFQYRDRPGVQCGGNTPNYRKYLVDYETDIWKKSHHLYLLHAAAPAIRRQGFAHVQEGQFDGIWMHKLGFTNTVVAMGVDLSPEQRGQLKRLTKRLIYWVEDEAGVKAIRRHLPDLMADGFEVLVIVTDGQDPDQICRKYGSAGVEMYVQTKARPAIRYMLDESRQRFDATVDQARARALREVIPTLQAIKDPATRLVYYGDVSRQYGVDLNLLEPEPQRIPIVSTPAVPQSSRAVFRIV